VDGAGEGVWVFCRGGGADADAGGSVCGGGDESECGEQVFVGIRRERPEVHLGACLQARGRTEWSSEAFSSGSELSSEARLPAERFFLPRPRVDYASPCPKDTLNVQTLAHCSSERSDLRVELSYSRDARNLLFSRSEEPSLVSRKERTFLLSTKPDHSYSRESTLKPTPSGTIPTSSHPNLLLLLNLSPLARADGTTTPTTSSKTTKETRSDCPWTRGIKGTI